MRLILAVDNALLSFFNKLAHAFARLTGRSNFFLAKIMISIVIMSCITTLINYWMPLLGYPTNLFMAVLYGVGALVFLDNFRRCDKAEETVFSENRIRAFTPSTYSPLFRFFVALFNILEIPGAIAHFILPGGLLLARILDHAYIPALTAFLYFAALDPPQVGKSKIQEWAEGFANLFRKPEPVPVKSK